MYVGFTGARFGSGNTAAQLDTAFDIRLMFYNGSEWIFDPRPTFGGAGMWITAGGRMNRQYGGTLSIGGRGGNRNFHGKVASFVTTTLLQGVAMPTDAEIKEMVTDPLGWLNDYKVGNSFRYSGNTNETTGFAIGNSFSSWSTQVWLMGDGINDSYSNMIRNQVLVSDQNYTKMNMINMVSNDIENVTIPGLS